MVEYRARFSRAKSCYKSQAVVISTTQETTLETTQEKILTLISKQPAITRKKIAEAIGLTPDGVKYHLSKLTTAGIIRHVGPTKTGHWEILKTEHK